MEVGSRVQEFSYRSLLLCLSVCALVGMSACPLPIFAMKRGAELNPADDQAEGAPQQKRVRRGPVRQSRLKKQAVADPVVASSSRASSRAAAVQGDSPSKSSESSKGSVRSHHGHTGFAIPTRDVAFKSMMSPSLYQSDPEIAMSFMNAFVPAFKDDPVTSLKDCTLNIPTLPDKDEKVVFMDYHVRTQSGAKVIMEMQVKYEDFFDERALYYAAYTFGSQLSGVKMKKGDWPQSLKPTYAIQVVNYNSQNLENSNKNQTMVNRVRANRMKPEQFMKWYRMKDEYSEQTIDHLQMIQIELPRHIKQTFPPQKDFTLQEWWLSLLKHAPEYTNEKLAAWAEEGLMPPDPILKALGRLDFEIWSDKMVLEYEAEGFDRDAYSAVLDAEHEMGRKEGEAKGREEGEKEKAKTTALKLLRRGRLSHAEIAEDTGLSLDVLQTLYTSLTAASAAAPPA